jgi:hypothetical protein
MSALHGPRVDQEEDMEARVKRLGQERPAMFTSGWSEAGFCFVLLTSMVMAVGAPQDESER